MRFKEFLKHPALQVGKMPEFNLQEADFDDGIIKHMQQLGYKKLGSGIDQMAFEEPNTGEVIKIFGYTSGHDKRHQMFERWANFCDENKSNPFLPKFSGWKKFNFNGQTYIQIRMERLIELPGKLADALQNIVNAMLQYGASRVAEEIIDLVGEHAVPKDHDFLDRNFDLFRDDMNEINKLAILLGDDFKTFLDTLVDIFKTTGKYKYGIDLHGGNFMHRYDGHPVIVDPWVV